MKRTNKGFEHAKHWIYSKREEHQKEEKGPCGSAIHLQKGFSKGDKNQTRVTSVLWKRNKRHKWTMFRVLRKMSLPKLLIIPFSATSQSMWLGSYRRQSLLPGCNGRVFRWTPKWKLSFLAIKLWEWTVGKLQPYIKLDL